MKLTEHQARLNTLSLVEYQTQISKQRELFPNSPFLDLKYDFKNLDFAATQTTVLVDGYKYSGIKKIFINNNFEVAAEFYKSLGSNLINTKFLYLPLSQITNEFILPFTVKVNNDSEQSQVVELPTEINLFDPSLYNYRNIYFYQDLNINQDYYHPFLPGFYFTGRVAAPNGRDFLYEYFDDAGYYGKQDTLYLSDLKPLTLELGIERGLRHPFGFPRSQELERSAYYSIFVGSYPTVFAENLWGKFTGLVATAKYSTNTYFLYEDDETEDNFLSLYPPTLTDFLTPDEAYNIVYEDRTNLLLEDGSLLLQES